MDNELLDGFFLRDVRIEPLTGTVHGQDGPIHLPPRSIEVLLCLAKSPRRLVTREHILNKVWGSPDASSEALSRVIGDIRHGLGDKVDDPTFLQTVPRRGYRLLVEPRPLVDRTHRRETDTSAPPFWQALVRHGVVQAVIAYVALGWLAIQFADTTFLNLNLPAWTVPFVTFVFVGGLPIVVLLSWFLEMAEGRIVDDKGQHTGGLLAGLGRNYLAIVAAYVVATAGAGVYQVLVGFEVPSAGPSSGLQAAMEPDIDSVLPIAENSVAVLRFDNLDGSEETDLFSAGLSEDILDRVARVPGLLVASRTDSWALPQDKTSRIIRDRLRVAFFLEGTVRIFGNEIAVVAQFIDSASGFHLFSKEIKTDLGKLNDVEQEITSLIVSELQVSLPEEIQKLNTFPSGSQGVDAYRLYRQAHQIMDEPRTPATIEEAHLLFEQALAVDPEYGAAFAGLCFSGIDLYQLTGKAADLEDAQVACGRAATTAPRLPLVHRARARLFFALGKLDESIASYESALELYPNDVDALTGMALVYERKQDTSTSVELLARAIDLQPGNWRPANVLAGLYFDRGEYEEAAGLYQRVLFLQPNNFELLGNMASAQMMAGDFERARYNFARALEHDDHPVFWTNLGILHYYLGDFETAVDIHRKNLETTPDDEIAWLSLADALHFANRKSESREAYQHAARLARVHLTNDPTNPVTLTTLSWALAMLGDTEDGLVFAQRAIDLDPDDPYSHYYLALVSLRSGDRDAASLAIQKALDLGYPEVMIDAEPYLAGLR